ncbi:hypothetical protein N7527_007389 [Penicillium freii]|nr:hypothetical protein N7527_007389 [Penicillium freii]
MACIQSVSFGGNNHGLQIGEHHGSIEFHTPEQPETPPNPLSTVPFPRDPDFARRDTLIDRIHYKRSVSTSRTVLVGLGGVGKSQLAIEYSYQVRSESPLTWIFWVHASNEARFEQSFRDIADQLKLPGRRDPRINIFQVVESWLRDERNGKWICVLDNVDNEFLCSPPADRKDDRVKAPTNTPIKPLLEYIPRSLNGFTIITSRSKEVALRMVDHKDLLEVKPMERSEALDLLQKKLGQPENSEESRKLVDALEFMPLAIVQATSYIRNRAPRYSVAQYLDDFQKSDREATRLLKKEAGHVYRDWEANNSILVTWQISFDYIRRTKPSAAELLSLMSFFDRQGIAENLIRHPPFANRKLDSEPLDDTSDEESSESEVGPDFEDDVDTLRNFSFIRASEDGVSFMMHRLVQLSTRVWLKSHGEEEQWQRKFIKNLAAEFPSGDYGTWEHCRALYPHVRAATLQRPEPQQCLLELADLFYRGALYALGMGLFSDMEEMASKSNKLRVKLLGPGCETTLESTEMLAIAYRNQGRWEEAEQLEAQVMETRKTKLGEDHPDTLTSMANLASTYWNQGRWEEAEQLEVQVMETSKAKLGEDHPDTLRSMANLASTYRNQGRWEEAEQLQVEVMETRKSKLGEDHPDTLTSMHNLSFTWKSSGHNIKAIDLIRICLTKRRERFGSDHPHTLSTSQTLLAWETENLSIPS